MRWWPIQKAPKGVAKTHMDVFAQQTGPDGKQIRADLGPDHMLVQSIAGLVAQAVNKGRGDEMVWIGINNDDYARWYDEAASRLGFEDRGTFSPWQLVDRYISNGLIKGYVLYSYDTSAGPVTTPHTGSDHSVNVATVAAGVLGGVLVSEGQEAQAKRAGLKLLFDARGKSEGWCFQRFKDSLHDSIALAQDPRVPHCRSVAVAHRMMVLYGHDKHVTSVYRWLRPGSVIIGWNGGDEGRSVSELTRQGHVLSGCNWSINIPLLSAGSQDVTTPKRLPALDPHAIDFGDNRHAVSFILSDGDNLQWLMGNYCGHKDYWASPDHGTFPFGMGACQADLMQACPGVFAHLQATKPVGTSLILVGGGYYYPDLLGVDRADVDRKQLLAFHARRIDYYMHMTGSRTLLLICMDVDSKEAKEAYRIFANNIQDLTGMFAIQYSPYEGGDGVVFWVANSKGIDIPVATCKYSLWSNLNLPGSGSPGKIAGLINAASRRAEKRNDLLNTWVIVHAWSSFEKTASKTGMGPENKAPPARGVSAAKWCVQQLDRNINVVNPEELLWRMRMRHDPTQTKECIDAWRRQSQHGRAAHKPRLFDAGPPPADTVDVVDVTSLSSDMKLVAATLQGLVNRGKRASVYLLLAPWDSFWLSHLKRKGYISNTRVLHPEKYFAKYADVYKEVIVYDPALPATVNIATMIAGLRNGIVVSPHDAPRFSRGKRLCNLRNRFKTNTAAYEWAFRRLWPDMNHRVLACYHPTSIPHHIRDYLVQNKVFTFWITGKEKEDGAASDFEAEKAFVEKLLAAAPANIPVMGFWSSGDDPGITEYAGVKLAGLYGKLTVPCDWGSNLSLLSGISVDIEACLNAYRNTRARQPPALDRNKVYVAFDVVDSGDAPHYWQSVQHTVWQDEMRGSMPINWSLSPALAELYPPLFEWFCEHATSNDSFVMAMSGLGYVFPYLGYAQRTTDQDAVWGEYLERTRDYMDQLRLRDVFLYTDAWRPFDRSVNDAITLRFADRLPNLRSLILGMGRDEGIADIGNNYLLATNRVLVSHVMTRWDHGNAGRNAANNRWLLNDIRHHTPEARPGFMHVHCQSWNYHPSDLAWVLERLGDGFVAVSARDFATLYHQAHKGMK